MSKLRVAIIAIAMALVAVTATIGISAAPRASANTTSTWSRTVAGTGISYGWTNDHAWVIADYADVITYGSGFIASQACGALMAEEGAFIGSPCGTMVRAAVSSLVAGKPYLHNHGLWVAVYVYPLHDVIGTY